MAPRSGLLHKIALMIFLRLLMMSKVRNCKNNCSPSKGVNQIGLFLKNEKASQCMASEGDLLRSKTLNSVPEVSPLSSKFPIHVSNIDSSTYSSVSGNTISKSKSKACKRMQLSKNITQNSILASFGNGRLGNQMCNFASQYALHKQFEVKSYFKNVSLATLRKTFAIPNPAKNRSSFHLWDLDCADPRHMEWAFISNMQLIQRKRKLLFTHLKYAHYIRLEAYVCDIKGFLPYLGELRRDIFRFKKYDMDHAKMIIKKIKTTASSYKKPVLVSIHLRLTDMGKHLANFNVSLASTEYFTSAMEFMKNKFGDNIVFAVFSDDIVDARRTLHTVDKTKFNIVFPSFGESSRSLGITLAALSLADHSILTYSTFGLWGALLRKNKGETIMPKETTKTDIGFYASDADVPGLTFL